ncbi:hypothetical protein RJT34_31461 [Clitoria ternatea]|uniref:Uncharacterized protein n=1 Tax=Clitoria ternatea TaxID=43366 RepID=A0AAN9EVM5_CLITE
MEAEIKQVSSIFDSHAEEAARSLLVLSKDKWPETKEIKTQQMEETIKVEVIDGENGRDVLFVQTQSQARVFKSGQALCGHKKMHFRNSMVANAQTNYSNQFSGKSVVDLNLPAPEEDEESIFSSLTPMVCAWRDERMPQLTREEEAGEEDTGIGAMVAVENEGLCEWWRLASGTAAIGNDGGESHGRRQNDGLVRDATVARVLGVGVVWDENCEKLFF